MKHTRLFVITATALVLQACGGGSGGGSNATPASAQTPKQRVQALEDSGSIPKLDRSASVAGTDADSNGVRDDVDSYIAANYTSATQKRAAQQFAGVMQSAIVLDTIDLPTVRTVAIRGSRAVNCIYTRFDGTSGSKQPLAVVEEIRAVSTNTKARLLAYLKYAKALDGTAGALPEGDTCE